MNNSKTGYWCQNCGNFTKNHQITKITTIKTLVFKVLKSLFTKALSSGMGQTSSGVYRLRM